MGGVRIIGGSCSRLQFQAQGVSPIWPSSTSSPPPLPPSRATFASKISSSVVVSSSPSYSTTKSGSGTSFQGRTRGGGIHRLLLTCSTADRSDRLRRRSPLLRTTSPNLLPTRRSLADDFNGVIAKLGGRSGKLQLPNQVLRRAFCSASLDDDCHLNNFFADNDQAENDEEFVRRLDDLSSINHSQFLHDPGNNIRGQDPNAVTSSSCSATPPYSVEEPPWAAIQPEQPNWPDRDGIVPASLEMKATGVGLPLSLRIIKRRRRRKKQRRPEEPAGSIDIKESAGDSACCSVEKAFSSMVFIVRELQSYTLRMRVVLCYENLQGILARVQGEMNASFVWLFEHIFSCTPTLMVCVMLLLANFTVYSIDRDSASALAMAAVPPHVPTTQAVVEIQQDYQQTLHQRNPTSVPLPPRPSTTRSISSIGRMSSVGGSSNGGGNIKPVAGAMDDGGGRSDGAPTHWRLTVNPDGISPVHGGRGDGSEGGAVEVTEEEETAAWNRIKEEASGMQASRRGEALMDPDTLQRLVSPMRVELGPPEEFECPDHWRTELVYHQALSQDPENAMVLCNFAQFLHLVLHDLDRAECCFERAAAVKPADAEALSRYANFLWVARNDLGAAEEKYLEAIAADPGNSYYAASYAHFLWNTGGEDTCYPLDDGDACG